MKTRKKKINKSPLHPFGGRAARPKAFVIEKGDRITTRGLRGRTVVKRITDEDGKRVAKARIVEVVKQPPAPKDGIGIWAGRVYTGVARSKPYPYRSTKRGGAPLELKPRGLMAGAAKAMGGMVKRIVTGKKQPVAVVS